MLNWLDAVTLPEYYPNSKREFFPEPIHSFLKSFYYGRWVVQCVVSLFLLWLCLVTTKRPVVQVLQEAGILLAVMLFLTRMPLPDFIERCRKWQLPFVQKGSALQPTNRSRFVAFLRRIRFRNFPIDALYEYLNDVRYGKWHWRISRTLIVTSFAVAIIVTGELAPAVLGQYVLFSLVPALPESWWAWMYELEVRWAPRKSQQSRSGRPSPPTPSIRETPVSGPSVTDVEAARAEARGGRHRTPARPASPQQSTEEDARRKAREDAQRLRDGDW